MVKVAFLTLERVGMIKLKTHFSFKTLDSIVMPLKPVTMKKGGRLDLVTGGPDGLGESKGCPLTCS